MKKVLYFLCLFMFSFMIVNAEDIIDNSCSYDNVNNDVLIYNTNGGNLIDNEFVCYTCENTFTFVVPIRVGYNFLGWYADEELTIKVESLSDVIHNKSLDNCINEEGIIYAKWEEDIISPQLVISVNEMTNSILGVSQSNADTVSKSVDDSNVNTTTSTTTNTSITNNSTEDVKNPNTGESLFKVVICFSILMILFVTLVCYRDRYNVLHRI